MWIRTATDSVLIMMETVRDAPGSYLAQCYWYEAPTAGSEYPFVTVVPLSTTEQELDTSTNKVEHEIRIKAIDLDKDKSAQEDKMRHLYDDIAAELRKKTNTTLWGTSVRILPIVSSWGWESASNAQARVFEVTVRVTEASSTE